MPVRPPVPSAGALLARWARERGDRPALADHRQTITYGQLERSVAAAAGAMAGLGVRQGDRVAASIPSGVDVVVAFWATQCLGAVWVGVLPALSERERAEQLADSGAMLYIATPETARLGPERPATLAIVVEAGSEGPGGSEWDRLCAAAEPSGGTAFPPPDPDAPATIAYTSGTTGRPKGVVHSQRNLLLPGSVLLSMGLYRQKWVFGVCHPVTQLNLMLTGPVLAALAGQCCVLTSTTDPVELSRWVRRFGVNAMAVVPTVLHGFVTEPGVRSEDLRSLEGLTVGGARCPVELRHQLRARHGLEFTLRYGQTEVPTVISLELPGLPLPVGSAGRPAPHLRVRAVDREGRALPAGEQGEICIFPAADGRWARAWRPMLEYWHRPGETAARLRGGMLHTGDMGTVGEDGSLFLLGRLDDVVIRGGANVFPAEVERVILEDARVDTCAVFGVADERLGEQIVAAVTVRRGCHVTPEEIVSRCRGGLAHYKVPHHVAVVEELPRTPIGKVDRTALRQLHAPDPEAPAR